LRSKNTLVQLPLPKIEATDVDKARSTVKAFEGKEGKRPTFLDTVQAFKVLEVAARKGMPNEVEVQVIAWVSDIAWVSLPGEIFVELGLAVKQNSPFKYTIIAELATVPSAMCLQSGPTSRAIMKWSALAARRGRGSCWWRRRCVS